MKQRVFETKTKKTNRKDNANICVHLRTLREGYAYICGSSALKKRTRISTKNFNKPSVLICVPCGKAAPTSVDICGKKPKQYYPVS